jgi:hypothetical protein
MKFLSSLDETVFETVSEGFSAPGFLPAPWG